MTAKPRMRSHLGRACVLASLAGCTTLSTDPLSPPHVRHASAQVQETAAWAEAKLSCEYQVWLDDVRHFWGETKREFIEEYDRNDAWPYPYNEMASRSAREPLAMQAQNAHLQMLTMWDYHFETGTGRVNAMGVRRLEDITDQAAVLGHTVYVRRTHNPHETAERLAEVREQLERLARDENAFEVVEAVTNPSTVSGEEAKKAVNLLIAPPKEKLSEQSSGGSSSSGSSGGK